MFGHHGTFLNVAYQRQQGLAVRLVGAANPISAFSGLGTEVSTSRLPLPGSLMFSTLCPLSVN